MYQPFNHRETAVLQEAVQILALRLNPVAIYCFGYRKNSQNNGNALFPETALQTKHLHFDLLVFAYSVPENAPADVSNIIHDKLGNVTVTLLLHSSVAFLKVFGNQEHFFWRVVGQGQVVYQSAQKKLEKDYPKNPFRNWHRSAEYWAGREAIAWALLKSQKDMNPDVETLRHTFLRITAEQICLGLIEVFLGYRPNHFALGYLFDICEIFTPIASQIFPRHTEEEKELFALLSTNISSLRSSESYPADPLLTAILERRCQTFLEKATNIIHEKLNHETVITNQNTITS